MRRALSILIVLLTALALLSSCRPSSDNVKAKSTPTAPPLKAGNNKGAAPGGGKVLTGTGEGPLGTGTIKLYRGNEFGKPADGFCDAVKEFSEKFGPISKPNISTTQLPEVLAVFKRMGAEAPPEIQARLKPLLSVADKMLAAQQNGEFTDEASAAGWVAKNFSAQEQQAGFADAATVLAYGASACRVPVE